MTWKIVEMILMTRKMEMIRRARKRWLWWMVTCDSRNSLIPSTSHSATPLCWLQDCSSLLTIMFSMLYNCAHQCWLELCMFSVLFNIQLDTPLYWLQDSAEFYSTCLCYLLCIVYCVLFKYWLTAEFCVWIMQYAELSSTLTSLLITSQFLADCQALISSRKLL